MNTYIMLVQWTQQGSAKIKESPARLEKFKNTLKRLGGELKGFYMVSGKYDIVIIVEAPDFETMAKVALASGAEGSVRTETLRAFTEDEYRRITTSLQ